MKHVLLAAAILLWCPTAFADPANILLDWDAVRGMSAEEYATAVQSTPDVNAQNERGLTALVFAARFGTPENIAALLSAGAGVNARDKRGRIALHWAARYGKPENITALLNAGADVNAHDSSGDTALHSAASSGST